VHDVIANGIYSVMNEVEYSSRIDRDDLLDKLEVMYEQSRDISYEKEEPHRDTVQKINTLLNVLKNKNIKMALSGNEPELWQHVSSKIKDQLEPVLQELLVNMNKHSRASQALITFEISNDKLLVSYRDNGVGIPENVQPGNGLRNTVSRIEALKGHIIFDPQTGEGTRLQIEIPLS
jgi:glucose-6-phosphate-specific signal transduction histidine kinase